MTTRARRASAGPTTCRSCGKPIVFATSRATGRIMPLELDQARGDWIIVGGQAVHEGPLSTLLEHPAPVVPRYVSHFSTCPQAGRWRR